MRSRHGRPSPHMPCLQCENHDTRSPLCPESSVSGCSLLTDRETRAKRGLPGHLENNPGNLFSNSSLLDIQVASNFSSKRDTASTNSFVMCIFPLFLEIIEMVIEKITKSHNKMKNVSERSI